eukprot:GFUD01075954.1.p1 GENE.GFUD01075954.1~~GFUD01075954.1.p1  ORF type:complete len:121 (-),score=15.21 GFUD01075954.1:86-424(-)
MILTSLGLGRIPTGIFSAFIYTHYNIILLILNVACGLPSCLLFLVSGILCITGPTLAIQISCLVVILFHVIIIILSIFFTYDEINYCNWIFNFAVPIGGMVLATAVGVYTFL